MLRELGQIQLRRRHRERVLVLRQQLRRELLDQFIEQQRRPVIEARHRRHHHVDVDRVALGVGLRRLEHAPAFRRRDALSDRCPSPAPPAACESPARSRPATSGLTVDEQQSRRRDVKCDDAGSAGRSAAGLCSGDALVSGCAARRLAPAASRKARNSAHRTDASRSRAPGRRSDAYGSLFSGMICRPANASLYLLNMSGHFRREHLGDDAGDVVFLALHDRVDADDVGRVAAHRRSAT